MKINKKSLLSALIISSIVVGIWVAYTVFVELPKMTTPYEESSAVPTLLSRGEDPTIQLYINTMIVGGTITFFLLSLIVSYVVIDIVINRKKKK